MDIFEMMKNNLLSAKSEESNNEQLKGILNKKAFGEADDFSDAGGFDDFVDGGTGLDSSGGSMGTDDSMAEFGSMGGGDDYGMDSYDMGDGQDQEGNVPTDALEFLENIDESEVHLVEDMLGSFSNLYKDQMNVYKRLLSENLDASEYSKTAIEVRNLYKTTLEILRDYITNKYKKENTVSRVQTLIEFKAKFNKYAEIVNNILVNMG